MRIYKTFYLVLIICTCSTCTTKKVKDLNSLSKNIKDTVVSVDTGCDESYENWYAKFEIDQNLNFFKITYNDLSNNCLTVNYIKTNKKSLLKNNYIFPTYYNDSELTGINNLRKNPDSSFVLERKAKIGRNNFRIEIGVFPPDSSSSMMPEGASTHILVKIFVNDILKIDCPIGYKNNIFIREINIIEGYPIELDAYSDVAGDLTAIIIPDEYLEITNRKLINLDLMEKYIDSE